MTAIPCSLLLLGIFAQPAQLEHSKWKSLGFSNHIYVKTSAGSVVSSQDIIRYLNRHTVPTASLDSFRPAKIILQGDAAKKVSAVTALIAEVSPSSVTLEAYAFQSTDRADLKPANVIWSYKARAVNAKNLTSAVNKGLDLLIADWFNAHGHRTRRE